MFSKYFTRITQRSLSTSKKKMSIKTFVKKAEVGLKHFSTTASPYKFILPTRMLPTLFDILHH